MDTNMRPTSYLKLAAGLCACVMAISSASAASGYVRVSKTDPRYFELEDGSPYIPNGLNMIAPPASGMPGIEEWLEQLSRNQGNFIRVWLSNPFFDVEHSRSGEYDEAKAERIQAMLQIAGRHGIRVKMCLEHFRHLGDGRQAWAAKPLHLRENGGTAKDIADFFNGEPSRQRFRQKLTWFADRFSTNQTVFGWELWNEVNAVQGGDYLGWTEAMLPELRRLFPRHLAMQSLGSYDSDYARKSYPRLTVMPGNDVAQVHRYLDLGAKYQVCHGPMDVLAADAVRELLSQKPGRPVLLAEGGAVEPNHTGPFKLYQEDLQGTLLHDVLFAPFFTGAAGPGHIWHWDHYVAKNNLWWHFSRFAEAVKGINPLVEAFEPVFVETEQLRVYALKGKRTLLAWCRDKQSSWRSELADKVPARQVRDTELDLEKLARLSLAGEATIYDPWQNRWSTEKIREARVRLPEFTRSVVVRVSGQAPQ